MNPLRRFLQAAPLCLGLATVLMTGCTHVQVQYPLLTESSADDVVLEKYYLRYIYSNTPDEAYETVNLGKLRNAAPTPTWAIKGWNPQESAVLLVRYLGGNRYLAQLTTGDANNVRKIELGLCEKHGRDLVLRALKSQTAKSAASHPLLQPLASSLRHDEKNHLLVIDELGVAQHGERIVESYKSLREDQLDGTRWIFRPTTDVRMVEALWAKKRREESEWLAARKAQVANTSPGDVMVHDIGFGILGYSKVRVQALRDEDPRVEVADLDGRNTRWVNPWELISEQAASAEKVKAARAVLDPLFAPPRK